MAEKNQKILMKDQETPKKGQRTKRKQDCGNTKKLVSEKKPKLSNDIQARAEKDQETPELRMTGAAAMEEAFLRFPHLPEQIFEILDNKSLANSTMVAISAQFSLFIQHSPPLKHTVFLIQIQPDNKYSHFVRTKSIKLFTNLFLAWCI